MSARIFRVSDARIELVDERGRLLAVARKCFGRDTWMLNQLGDQGTPEWVEGELAVRARLAEIGGAS